MRVALLLLLLLQRLPAAALLQCWPSRDKELLPAAASTCIPAAALPRSNQQAWLLCSATAAGQPAAAVGVLLT